MAIKETSSNFLELFAEGAAVRFCSYKELGLLCFDGKSLSLISVVPPKSKTDRPLFVRSTTIKLDSEIPDVSDIAELSSSTDGRFVALSAQRSVYIVEMHGDLWNAPSLFSTKNLDVLRKEYTAKCEILNINLMLSKRSGFIRKVVWHHDEKHSHVLGVLHANSLIRIYNINASISAPFALADFQPILGINEDVSAHDSLEVKRFGLFSEIVSFDFGPILSKKSKEYLTVFVLDSDGEVYYSVNSLNTSSTFHPIGPIDFSGKSVEQKTFYYNAVEILFVKHSASSTVPVFSLCSDQGEIFHLVLSQAGKLDTLLDTGKNIYELVIYDSLQIENWSLQNSDIILKNNHNSIGEYILVTASEVFFVDIEPWVRQMISSLSDPDSFQSAQSEIRHVFRVMSTEVTLISAVAALKVELNSASAEFAYSDLMLFAVFDSSPRFTANFIQRQLGPAETMGRTANLTKSGAPGTPQRRTFKERLSQQSIKSIPHLSTTSLNANQRLDTISQAIQSATSELICFQANINAATKQGAALVQSFDRLEEKRGQLCDRLIHIFDSVVESKRRVAELKKQIKALDDRYSTIANYIQSRIYASDDTESDALKKLESVKDQCSSLVTEIQTVNERIRAERTSDPTASKPFQASSSVQKFMLSKTATELTHLKAFVDRLNKDLDSLPH